MHSPEERSTTRRHLAFLIIFLFITVAGIAISGSLLLASHNASVLKVKFRCSDLIPADKAELQEWAERFNLKNLYFSRVTVELTSDCELGQTFRRTENVLSQTLKMINIHDTSEEDNADIISADISWISRASESITPIDICPNNSSRSDNEFCINQEDIYQHFPFLISYARLDGIFDRHKVMGVPLWADIGLLFYNKNFIETQNLPKTWSEMVEVINSIKRKRPELLGFTWQGQAYEGLVCNLLEWIANSNDLISGIYDRNGHAVSYTIHVNAAVKAVEVGRSWIWQSKISPHSVLENDEMKSVREFSNGNIIFMRNWPRAWDELRSFTRSEPDNNFSVSLLPASLNDKGLRGSGVLGGWLLAIPKNAKNKKLALELIKDFTSKNHQLRRAREGAFLPTIRSAYDQLVQHGDKNSFFQALHESIESQFAGERITIADILDNGQTIDHVGYAIERPSADLDSCYEKFSEHLSKAIHKVLALEKDSNYIRSELDNIRTELSECKGVPVILL